MRFKTQELETKFLDKLQTFCESSQKMSNIRIFDFNNQYNSNLDKLNKYIEDVEFLIIQRKNSYSFMEIMNGTFNISNRAYLYRLFEELHEEERTIIKTETYDEAMRRISNSKYNRCTPEQVERYLKIRTLLNNFNKSPLYPQLEWGFPKGRRNWNESEKDCSIREFCEETSYEKHHIKLLNLAPVDEIFKGNNNIMYKTTYLTSILSDSDKSFIPLLNSKNNMEVNKIEWVTLSVLIDKLRNYHVEKKKIILEIYKFLVNILELECKISDCLRV